VFTEIGDDAENNTAVASAGSKYWSEQTRYIHDYTKTRLKYSIAVHARLRFKEYARSIGANKEDGYTVKPV